MLSLQVAVLLAASAVGETVLIDFSADWCGPCRQMDPVVQELSGLGYPVRKVNIDHDQALASQFGVRSIPCFVLVVDGREVDRVVGGTSFERLRDMLVKHGVATGSAVNEARGQSPDSGRRRPSTFATSSSQPAIEPDALRAPAAGDAPLTARLMAASVRLKIEDPSGHSYGSGTIIDASRPEVLILTCGHIFRDSKGEGRVTVDLFGAGAPQGLPGRVVSYDLKSDVGLVSFRPGSPVQAVPVAEAGYQVSRGDKVISIGCNNGGEPSVRQSHVTSLDKFLGPPNVQVAGQPVQGRSGGGLFSAEGFVIGVCNAADPADDEGLYAALPSIWAQLKGHPAPLVADRSQQNAGAQAGTAGLAAGHRVPAMPQSMPSTFADEPLVPQSHLGSGSTTSAAALSGQEQAALSGDEQAALAAIQQRGGAAEVICIVRSLNDSQAASEVIVLDKASPQFLSSLNSERARQGRHQTSDQRIAATGQTAAPSAQPRPVQVRADVLTPASNVRKSGAGWRPQWLKPR